MLNLLVLLSPSTAAETQHCGARPWLNRITLIAIQLVTDTYAYSTLTGGLLLGL